MGYRYNIKKEIGGGTMALKELLERYAGQGENLPYRSSFETFKSNVCHLVKEKGDMDFIADCLKGGEIRTYWNRKWYLESFYLLAMVDYLSRENGLPICSEYNDIRKCSLTEPIYPRDVRMAERLDPDLDRKRECMEHAIPEFLKYNIVEGEIRNVY